MQARINYPRVDPEVNKTLFGLWKYVLKSGIEQSLLDLILVRASQINRCAGCLDMHTKDARPVARPTNVCTAWLPGAIHRITVTVNVQPWHGLRL